MPICYRSARTSSTPVTSISTATTNPHTRCFFRPDAGEPTIRTEPVPGAEAGMPSNIHRAHDFRVVPSSAAEWMIASIFSCSRMPCSTRTVSPLCRRRVDRWGTTEITTTSPSTPETTRTTRAKSLARTRSPMHSSRRVITFPSSRTSGSQESCLVFSEIRSVES